MSEQISGIARLGTRARKTVVALAAGSTVLAASGCGLTVESLPLPKPGVSGDTYTLHAVFANALNLPDQAKVKIGGSDVGVVTHIETKNFQALVDMKIRKDIVLPANSTAELRQATPLGDVFIAVSMPKAEPGSQTLKNGDTVPIGQTSAGATVEELLLSVSMLFNGGGLADLAKLSGELDSVVGGRSDKLADLIKQMTSVVGTLHDDSDRIDAMFNGFDTLTNTLQSHHDDLSRVADTLPGMVGAVAESNKNIGDLLTKVSTATQAIGDYADTTSPQLAHLLDTVHALMDALAKTSDTLGPAMDAVHDIRPAVDASFRGTSLAVAVAVTSLDASVLSDPAHGKIWDGRDVAEFTGSLIQALQVIQYRLGSTPK